MLFGEFCGQLLRSKQLNGILFIGGNRSLSITHRLLSNRPRCGLRYSSTNESINVKGINNTKENDDLSFDSLSKNQLIDNRIIYGIKKCGFTHMTPVQAKSIKVILEDNSGVVARAKTGTGKTLAFGIPLLESAIKERIKLGDYNKRKINSIIIAPTRDLALQIQEDLKIIIEKHTQLKSLNISLIVGGEMKDKQMKDSFSKENPADILIATPGRLIDFMENGKVDKFFNNVKYTVIDEADRLLDDGFKASLLQITRYLKEHSNPRSLLFSATIDKNAKNFAASIMGENYKYVDTIDANEMETNLDISQELVKTTSFSQTLIAGMAIVKQDSSKIEEYKTIVFLPTIRLVDFFDTTLAIFMKGTDVPIWRLHGKLTLHQRQIVVESFKKANRGVLVTSDVGARGMDFPNVTHVIQIGICSQPATYVHRIGRTGRAGNSGNAIMILSKIELGLLKELQNRGISISRSSDFEAVPNIMKLGNLALQQPGTQDLISSLLSFYCISMKAYNIQPDLLIASALQFNKDLGHTTKPKIPSSIWRDQLRLSPQAAFDYFDLTGGDESETKFIARSLGYEGNFGGFNREVTGKSARYGSFDKLPKIKQRQTEIYQRIKKERAKSERGNVKRGSLGRRLNVSSRFDDL